MDPQFTFRRLANEDLPLLHHWLNEPGVVEWWEGDDVSWDAVVADHSPDNDEPCEEHLGLIDGEPVGWIQCYAVDDYDDEDEVIAWFGLGYPDTGAGIDYLIGDPGERGSGRGSAMIRAYIDQVVWPEHPEWTDVGASPQRANVASCGALRKAGLTLFGSFEDPEFGPCDLWSERRPGVAR